jgi:hypothetical protein
LKSKGYEFVEPAPASEEELLTVHDSDYIWKLKKSLVEDSDTPAYDNIYEYAKLSVGGALLARRIGGFSLMRPPGHHVGRNGAALGVYTQGFCYFNNIAIATPNQRFNLKDEEDDFLSDLFGALSKREKRKILKRMERGRLEASRKGNCIVAGRPKFGYDYNHLTKRMEINPKEAEIVKRIFSGYLADEATIEVMGIRDIP